MLSDAAGRHDHDPRARVGVAVDTQGPLSDLPPGWFNHGPLVLDLLEQHRPRVVVELGTWLGASAIAMARSVRRWGGTVTCVDIWSGAMNADGGAVLGPPLMLASCARAMIEAGISASVRLIPSLSGLAAATWRGPIDCLYIDADHSAIGCRVDLEAWAPFVVPGGLIMGDDYDHPRYPGVRAAWDAAEAAHGWTLTRSPINESGVRLIYGVI